MCKSIGVGKPWKGVCHQMTARVDFFSWKKHRRNRDRSGELVINFLQGHPMWGLRNLLLGIAQNAGVNGKFQDRKKMGMFSIPIIINFEPQPYIHMLHFCKTMCLSVEPRWQRNLGPVIVLGMILISDQVIELVDGWNPSVLRNHQGYLGQQTAMHSQEIRPSWWGFWTIILPQWYLNKVLLTPPKN